MNPSELRDRVTIQRLTTATKTWANIEAPATVWAAVEPQGDETYRIRIRYRADLRGMKDAYEALRILWRDRTLRVLDITESEWHRECHLTAEHVLVESTHLATGAKRRQPWPA